MIKNIIKRLILEDLIQKRMWGGKHTEIINLKKGLPSNILSTNKGQKLVNKAIKELINNRLLLCKKSTDELHVSLNPKAKKDIMELVLKY